MNAPVVVGHAVRVADLSDVRQRTRIDEFVREHNGSLFHRPSWLAGVERGTRNRALGLITERLGVVTGWLPLTEARSMLFGKALVSCGFGVGGGILAESEDSFSQLEEAARNHAQIHGFESVELRGQRIPRGWREVSGKHCSFVRDLAENEEAQLLAIPRKARAEVRKGKRNGLEVRVGRSSVDLAEHYAIYAESVRNLGTPVFPKMLFEEMLEVFPEESDILTVRKDGEPLASVLSFYHQGAVMPYWGGGKLAARSARANELMYYELMLHARKRGMRKFDFGRSKTGSGPFTFKKNWGFEPEPLTYGIWAAPGRKERDIDPTGKRYARKIALWKRLPLPIANKIGPMIARGLA